MYLPNEILNIIFSYVPRPISFHIINTITTKYKIFLQVKPSCHPLFHIYFFRVFLPIWKRWPENFLTLYHLQYKLK